MGTEGQAVITICQFFDRTRYAAAATITTMIARVPAAVASPTTATVSLEQRHR